MAPRLSPCTRTSAVTIPRHMVDDFGFGTCTRHPANATVYDSGNDRIRLSRGLINFINGVSDNCYKGGVKISLTVRP
uniref:Uncharacterized protein n=1 Tax=Aegilops tauschii TaxID=37682 RepID=N1R1P8_AEGTA